MEMIEYGVFFYGMVAHDHVLLVAAFMVHVLFCQQLEPSQPPSFHTTPHDQNRATLASAFWPEYNDCVYSWECVGEASFLTVIITNIVIISKSSSSKQALSLPE